MKKLCPLLLLLSTVSSIHAQKFEKENLYSIWYLDKYSDAEAYYKPSKKEIGDYFTFNKDMTYSLKSEGEPSSGTWMFNTNGNYIELKEEDGNTEKLYVYFLSKKSFVFSYDTDEYRIWEAHYVSCN
ncbi:copper resistance protein NlpE [Flagellimonas sp. HMM57]|uniref:lipocalin family protein n=1 Tax=unclassified Flagellimonas TaxID=2644544 RepID=UPI0013CFDBB5|nr:MULTISPECIES: lipocalin family protein [unclassified Flagellimonas]UII75725.1 copper resistance protein NlpE [Flagellimonas sp. HMM57]